MEAHIFNEKQIEITLNTFEYMMKQIKMTANHSMIIMNLLKNKILPLIKDSKNLA